MRTKHKRKEWYVSDSKSSGAVVNVVDFVLLILLIAHNQRNTQYSAPSTPNSQHVFAHPDLIFHVWQDIIVSGHAAFAGKYIPKGEVNEKTAYYLLLDGGPRDGGRLFFVPGWNLEPGTWKLENANADMVYKSDDNAERGVPWNDMDKMNGEQWTSCMPVATKTDGE